jgi:hypothetical protein
VSKTTFTEQEAAQIASEYFHKRVAELTKSLRDLRERELAKAIVPPHKHTTGTTSSSGVEDIPPGKSNPPGKNDAMKGEYSPTSTHDIENHTGEERTRLEGKNRTPVKRKPYRENTLSVDDAMKQNTKRFKMGKEEMTAEETSGNHPPEETSGEKSPDDLKKEGLCKDCGKGHGMEKCMGKAMLRDSKGKVKDNGIHPESVLPKDSKATEINKPTASDAGSGGVIKKAATPPTAKPPSGKNMGTGVPTSAPATPKMPMAKVGLPADGGMKAHMSAAASMAGKPAAAPAPKVQLPSPAQHADRASQFADFTPGAGVTGHAMGGPKKPGIFGRLGKSEDLAKGTVTQPIPKLKPAAAGLHTAGGTPAMTAMTSTAASPDKTSILSKPAAANPMAASGIWQGGRNILGKPASPVLVPRPAVKLPGAHLKTAGASGDNTEGDKTQQTATAGAKPSTIKPKV